MACHPGYRMEGQDCVLAPPIPAWIKIGSNVMIDAVTGGTTWSFPESVTYTKIKFVHRSGSVSCNAPSAGGTRFSNWGCDKNGQYLGVLLLGAGGSHICPPANAQDVAGLTWYHSKQWYQMSGQHTMSNPLVFDYSSTQHYAAGSELRIKYGEADGNSAHDNGGKSYLDVWAFGTAN